MKKPYILLTNDDGIEAEGLKVLAKALEAVAELSLVAPQNNCSGKSCSITIKEPLSIRENHDFAFPAYAISGTPADCVKFGLSYLLPKEPDFVISGINDGSNAGNNVLYSGTVCSLIPAAQCGIPGMALSCCNQPTKARYELAKDYIIPLFESLQKEKLEKGRILNVNFPTNEKTSFAGVKATTQGKAYWAEAPEKRLCPSGQVTYYWLGMKHKLFLEEKSSDIYWLEKNYVTVTCLKMSDLSCPDSLRRMEERLEKQFSSFQKK